MSEATIIKNGFIAIKDGKILKVGENDGYKEYQDENTQMFDLKGKTATPGLIDCHTHLVYGGSREHEFSMKLNGVSYLDILAQGGGILSTQKATREASFETLYNKSEKLLNHMMYHGVTTVEAKSGYGLDWETEKRQMEVVKKLDKDLPIDLVSTFMAAHAIPQEYKEDPDKFIDEVIEMLPRVIEEDLAEFCDVFCEKGVFNAEQSKRLLKAAQDLGMKTRIHADEIVSIGGSKVAAELHTTSAEHLMMITDEDIKGLADSGVIANLLPATTFSLMEDTYAPARKMLDNNVAITLTTDSNPGSCPTANLQFAMQLGSFALKLTPIEVYNAVTINAAHSVARGDVIGSFKEGKNADITIFDAPNVDYTIYFFATNLVTEVFKNGELVIKDRQRV